MKKGLSSCLAGGIVLLLISSLLTSSYLLKIHGDLNKGDKMNIWKTFTFWRTYLNALFIILLLIGSMFYISKKELPEISRTHFQETTDAEVIYMAEVLNALVNQYLSFGDNIQELMNERDLAEPEQLLQNIAVFSFPFDGGVILDNEAFATHVYPPTLSSIIDTDYLYEYVEETIMTKEITISTAYGIQTKKPYIGVSIPLLNEENEIEHIIHLGSYTEENLVLSALLNRSELGSEGYSGIIDKNGIVIAHRDPDRIGEQGANPIVQKLLNGESGYEKTYNYEGIPFYASYKYIPGLEWGIIAQVPVSSTYTLLQAFESSIWKIGFVSVLLLSFLTFFYAQKTLQPFHRMYNAIDHIAEGKYKQRLVVNFTWYPEMKKLVERFNEMVDNINASRQEIEHQAYHDALTGLPNRYKLEKHLKNAMKNCDMNGQSLTLFFIDLDRFKRINDLMGHHVGDCLLIEAADRIKKAVPKNSLIARQGGDEFIILVESITDQQAAAIAQKVIDQFSTPFTINDQEFFTSPSIGISFYPKDGETLESIIKHADTAMYLAKERGKNNFQFYTIEPSQVLDRQHKLENGLRRAIEKSEFILYYQPQIDLQIGGLRGFEALIRWENPELGVIPPNEFIPLAEETSLINEIGNWVIKEACTQNKMWQEAGLDPMPIAVNVSPSQFRNQKFVGNIIDVLEKTKLDPQYLEIEITESTMLDYNETIDKLHKIREIGVKVSIDDFGTGYASLSNLDDLPINTLKIDRSFINHLLSNSNKAAIVKTIIDLGHHLNFEVVAEGIEHPEQVDFLKKYNCHIGQGYLFNRPLTVLDVEVFYKELFRNVKTSIF